jgi:type I restriction enzyme S subunit
LSGIDKKTSEGEVSVRLCNYTTVYYNDNIDTETPLMTATATDYEISQFELRKGDVLCTKDSETPEDIAKCAHVLQDMPGVLCGYHLALLRPREGIEGPFLCQALNTPGTRLAFSRCANGVTRFGLSGDAFDQVQIPVPAIDEQRVIAAVLTTADDEIKTLANKAAALERQKKGLMQKLLTGEVRVKTS